MFACISSIPRTTPQARPEDRRHSPPATACIPGAAGIAPALGSGDRLQSRRPATRVFRSRNAHRRSSEPMGAAPDFSHFVKTDADGRSPARSGDDGITCAGLPPTSRTAMKRLPGRKAGAAQPHQPSRSPSPSTPRSRAGAVSPRALEAYRLSRLSLRAAAGRGRRRRRAFVLLLKCLGVAVFAAMNIMLLSIRSGPGEATSLPPETRDFFHFLSGVIALPAAA